MKTRLLVTGGAGFIGSNFIRFLRHHRPDYRVINLDCLAYSGNLDNLADIKVDPNYKFLHGNICDRAVVGDLFQNCDAVVHFAAESHVDRSIRDATPFIHSNVLGTQTLLDTMLTCDKLRFVYVSTDEVYGSLPIDQPNLTFVENSPIAPNSPYAASKAAGDMMARAYHRTHGLDILTTRCSNNFGPYQFPEKVIPNFVTRLIRGKNVPLYGDGKNVRDWIHVDDHCEGILKVLECGKSGEAYNIGGNNECSNLELTEAILELLSCSKDRIDFVPDRLGHDRRYAICGNKMRQQLGWVPTRSAWPDALKATVQWYVDNQDWWRRVESREFRSNQPVLAST